MNILSLYRMFVISSWTEINATRKIRLLKFWNRIINIDGERLIKIIFLYDLKKCKNNWCCAIRKSRAAICI